MSLQQLCYQRGKTQIQQVAINAVVEQSVQSLTYKTVDQRARGLAAILQSKDMAGKHALIALDSGVNSFVAIMACFYAGVTPVLFPYVSGKTRHKEIANIALLASASVAISEKKSGDIRHLVWIQASKAEKSRLAHKFVPQDNSDQEILLYEYNSYDKAALLRLRLSDLIHNAKAIIERLGPEVCQQGIATHHNLYTAAGLMTGLVMPILANCQVWLLRAHEVMQNPLDLLKLLSIKKLAICTAESNLLGQCKDTVSSKELTTLDFDYWKVALTIEAEVDMTLVEQVKQYFFSTGLDPATFYAAYGRKELGLVATARAANTPMIKLYLNKHELCKGKAEIVHMSHNDATAVCGRGKALPDYHITIMREGGKVIDKPYEVGELYISSPYLSPGFYCNDKLNARYFITDENGKMILKTGHLAFLDENQELFITGNIEDIVIVRDNFINLKDFGAELINACEPLTTNNLVLFKEKKGQLDRLIILLETELAGNQLTQLYDQIIEVACRDIELNSIFIAVFKPGTLPKARGLLDRTECIHAWQQEKIKAENTWQLPISSKRLAKKGIIPLHGLSDKRKAEKLSDWLYAWLGLKTGQSSESIDERRHLSYYGFGYINAIILAHEINLVFRQWVKPSSVWEFNNLKALTRFLFSEAFLDDRSPTPNLAHKKNKKYATLCSYNEEDLFRFHQQHPDNASQYLHHAFKLHGPLDLAAFKRALQTVANKHVNLRSGFVQQENQLFRVIKNEITPAIEEYDFSALPQDEQEETFKSICLQLENNCFDSLEEPAWRLHYHKLNKNTHQFIFDYHRLLIDYWSAKVILRDLSQCYNAEILGYQSILEKEKITYSNFVAWQRQCVEEDSFIFQNFYWEHRLEAVRPLYLPYDIKPNETIEQDSSYLFFVIDENMAERLRNIAAQNEIDLYTLFVSAYQSLLYWLSAETNITIRCNQCNRHQKDFLYVVGNMENYFLLPEKIHARSTYEDLFAINRESLTRSCQSLDTPYQTVLAMLDNEIQQIMPNCAFDFHYFPQEFHFEDMQISEQNFNFRFPHLRDDGINLHLQHFVNGKQIDCRLHYRKPLFSATTANAITEKYANILAKLLDNAHMPIQHVVGKPMERSNLQIEKNNGT